jgi:hypothetical protein
MPTRIAAAVVALCGFAAAVVQLNDPDAPVWFAVYFAAGVLGVLAAANRLAFGAPLTLSLFCFAWAATIAPRVVGTPGFPDFGMSGPGPGMLAPNVEETREMFGLLINGACMAALAARAFVQRKRKVADPR